MSVRAITVEATGGPEVLVMREAAALSPGSGELLVLTAAVGVNFIETYQRSGVYPVDLPFVPGTEAAGTVLEAGSGVTDFAPGDLVTTAQGVATYAEQFLVDADRVARVPAGIDPETAAALPMQGLTAHYLSTSSSHPEPGDTVLVHAGAGGVGLLLTQLLTARGVRVITTASTPEKRELSRAAGATDSLDYDGFLSRVRDLTDGDGVAVVYDGVGRATFDDSLRALRVRGEMVLFGGSSGQVPPFDLQRLNAGGSLSVTRPFLGHFLRTPDERVWRFGELFDAISRGDLDVRIGARFPLADAADAHRALEGRATTGKVLLLP